jgi:hypothetical protein
MPRAGFSEAGADFNDFNLRIARKASCARYSSANAVGAA